MSEDIEEKALELVKPRPEDYARVKRVFSEIKERIETALREQGVEAEIHLEGSVAKDTWLKDSPELDIFVILPRETGKEGIREKVFPALWSALEQYNPVKNYSEHPYLTLSCNGVQVDVVPALKRGPNDPVRTAVDRTPLHTEYVKSKTDEKLRDEIRLLKRFAKTIGVYGAEIKVEGFSGYLLELLAIYYGGFRKTLEAACKWKPPIIIDIEGFYKSKEEILRRFEQKPMIVIDPTDKNRNVAAALSLRRIAEFSLASRLYLMNPSIHYFKPWQPNRQYIENLKTLLEPYHDNTLLVIASLDENLPPDTIWGEAKRSLRILVKKLRERGFSIVRYDAWCNEKNTVVLACMLESSMLSKKALQRGPPFYSRDHSLRFIEKYVMTPGSGPWVNDEGRLESLRDRDTTNAVGAVKKEIGNILVSHLARSKWEVTLLSWKPELLTTDDVGPWLLEFLWGKPKWLLPHLAAVIENGGTRES